MRLQEESAKRAHHDLFSLLNLSVVKIVTHTSRPRGELNFLDKPRRHQRQQPMTPRFLSAENRLQNVESVAVRNEHNLLAPRRRFDLTNNFHTPAQHLFDVDAIRKSNSRESDYQGMPISLQHENISPYVELTIATGMEMKIYLFAALNTPKLVRSIKIVQCPDLAKFIAPATVESSMFNRGLQQVAQHDLLVRQQEASPF